MSFDGIPTWVDELSSTFTGLRTHLRVHFCSFMIHILIRIKIVMKKKEYIIDREGRLQWKSTVVLGYSKAPVTGKKLVSL